MIQKTNSPRLDRDPYIYPVATEYLAFGAKLVITATSARNAMSDDEANATAADPSYKGDRSGYEKGQTIRALPFNRDAFQ